MSTGRSQASAALLARISELARLQFGDGHVVALPAVGRPLAAEHLELLRDFGLAQVVDPGQAQRLLELSRCVDCVQDGRGGFRGPEQDPGYLSDRFRAVLRNAAFATAQVEPGARRQYDQAMAILYTDPPFEKTDAYAHFGALRTDLEQKELSRLELERRLSLADDEADRRLVEGEIARLRTLIDEQRDVVEALDREHAFVAAERLKDRVEASLAEVPAAVREALAALELFKITAPGSNDSHVGCSFLPGQLSEDNWTPVRMTRREIADAPGPRAVLESPRPAVAAFLDDNAIDAVEIDVQMVAVQRAWFWSGLFENRLWDWKVTPSEPVSDGADSGHGLIPAYVAGLIVARNLVVRGTAPALDPATRSIRVGNIETAPCPREDASSERRLPQGRRISGTSDDGAGVPFEAWRRSRAMRPEARPARAVVRVRGTVADEHGRPVAGAAVSLREVRAAARPGRPRAAGRPPAPAVRDHRVPRRITARDGRFELHVLAGTYVLRAGRTGYVATTRRIVARQSTDLRVALRSEKSDWPLLVIRLGSPQGAEPFEGRSEIQISSVGAAPAQVQRLPGQAEVGVRLPPGRYRVAVVSPDARQVVPPSRVIDVPVQTSIDFVLDSGILVRNPGLHLVGFVCRRVPKCPDPDRTLIPERQDAD
jgi:hypothetical protein